MTRTNVEKSSVGAAIKVSGSIRAVALGVSFWIAMGLLLYHGVQKRKLAEEEEQRVQREAAADREAARLEAGFPPEPEFHIYERFNDAKASADNGEPWAAYQVATAYLEIDDYDNALNYLELAIRGGVEAATFHLWSLVESADLHDFPLNRPRCIALARFPARAWGYSLEEIIQDITPEEQKAADALLKVWLAEFRQQQYLRDN